MKQTRPALQLSRLAAASSLLFAGAAAQAQAVAVPPASAASAPQQLDTVIVTGIRKSLESSVALKRNAHGVVDGIVAEDIGKFPDTNLAEAMQRISGVSIDRSIGEGSRVTVRGVGPDFNLVLLNGRQMPASSIQDATASSSRAFDFANLASESIAALEVYKTSRAASPTGGMGATINIRTARPLDSKEMIASVGVKAVKDQSNTRLPNDLSGNNVTPEVSAIYSNVFADGRFGVALSGSYQRRDLGYNQAAVSNGWRTFKGDESNWGTIPQPGTPGSERITNRPKPGDVYQVPQNIGYSLNGVQRERTNGQLTLQFAPTKDLVATLDHTYSENKLRTRRNDLSAWFNFGPSTSSWTNGPAAAPTLYSEIINPATSDIAMGGALFATKNLNRSTGINLNWKASDKLTIELDAHSSTATSGADSPFGSSGVLGTASFNRGTTSVDFSQDFPVLSIPGSKIDASLQQVTGSSFRNSYSKAGVDQAQLRGKYKIDEQSQLDFGLAATKVDNRSAYGNVDRGTWGGASSAADYPDSLWHADTLAKYFTRIGGSNNPALFNQFYTWNFEQVRDIAAKVGGESLYRAPTEFSIDRRTKEKSQSLYGQYSTEWNLMVPIGMTAGLRYEKTEVTSNALVPTATGIEWGSNNELAVLNGPAAFTTLKGKYSHVLPSIDFDAELSDKTKLRLSYGESLGRPGWGDLQGGQTLNNLVRVDGGQGQQGNPGLKPLKSKNFDLSLEHYYDKGSFFAVGLFRKNISNYIGTSVVQGTPFNLHTPIGGALYKEAVAKGCVTSDNTCIRNYILRTYDGTRGVKKNAANDALGNATGVITGQTDDPIANFLITTPANQRKDSLNGVELNAQHTFRNGFGFSANYTWVRSGLKYDNTKLGEQFALEGVSNSANAVGFYEDNKLSARLAYNWRGQFLAGRFDGTGGANPIYVEPYGQWDLSLGYKLSEKLSVQFEAINLTDEISRSHERAQEALAYVTQTGRRFMIGARYKF